MSERHVLVVDDDLEILKFYRRIFSGGAGGDLDILGDAGAGEPVLKVGCRAYSDPKTMVADYRRAFADGVRQPLCIVDMRMPEQNGLVTAEQVREIDPDIDILICSAAGDFTPEEIRRRLGGRVFFVRKPFDAGEFSLMVQSLIDYWDDRQELRRQTAFLTSLLESVSDLIFMKDARGIYMTCNKVFARFAKRTPQQIIGGTDCDFLPSGACRTYLEQDIEVLDTGRSLTHHEWVDHPDGGKCLLETVKSPVYSEKGECIGLIGIARDITNREAVG
jgi:PAS domain S-box-containing protein